MTTEEFPPDLDTTAIGLTVLKYDKDIVRSVMDEMLGYVNADGIIQVSIIYCHVDLKPIIVADSCIDTLHRPTLIDHRRPRLDPVVCVNVLDLFYAHGRGSQLQQTLKWVHDVLKNRAYLEGTRYYETPECFLYFISRLLSRSRDPNLHALLKPLLKERIQERIGAEGNSSALSMRIITCDYVGIRDEVDLRKLLTFAM